MKNNKLLRRVLCTALVLALGAGLFLANAASVPAKAALKSGVTVYKNNKATVDASNLAEGFVSVQYTGGKQVKIKAQITKVGTALDYTYNLGTAAVTLPLTEGDGEYTIKILENTTGTSYAQAYSCKVTLKLRDPFLPFLYTNQFVNFNADSAVVAKAADLVEGKTTDLEKLTEIYHFTVNTFTYDYELAKTVRSGYLPDVDKVLDAKKGICFDYAAVMSAMLRSQNIPCKLVVGYAGKIYHAWINVYLPGTGWVDKAIYFDGTAWSLMDPTFVSSGNSSAKIMKYVTNSANYTQSLAY